jgi:hypothetical protein
MQHDQKRPPSPVTVRGNYVQPATSDLRRDSQLMPKAAGG